MRWTPGNRGNIQDARGTSVMRGAAPIGLGGFVLLLALSWATGVDLLSPFAGGGPSSGVATTGEIETTPEEERLVDFVDAVAGDIQDTWERLLPDGYRRTQVKLFRDAVQSNCGFAEAATGPFYCPRDGLIYLDLGFFRELDQRLGAPGDFAQAYVVGHEFGHHVQNLLGDNARVQADRSLGPQSASVALELQADCYAGVWAHAAAQPGGPVDLDPGDAEEGLQAAAAIGDDRLQKMSTGRVAPERFSHGTSAQRVQWFRRGMDSGDPRNCRTQ
jgi:predicted metalloprotease